MMDMYRYYNSVSPFPFFLGDRTSFFISRLKLLYSVILLHLVISQKWLPILKSFENGQHKLLILSAILKKDLAVKYRVQNNITIMQSNFMFTGPADSKCLRTK